MSQLSIVPKQLDLPPLAPERFTANQNPFYPRFDSSEMEHLMHQFNIDPQKVLTQHSYGQRKKFLIAFSLAAKDRKSTRLNSSHVAISYAVFCLKKKNAYYVRN